MWHNYILLFIYLVAFPLTPKYITLNGHFTLSFHYYEPRSAIRLHIYCRVCLHTPSEMCGSGPWIPWSAEYWNPREKLRIFRRRFVVGTLAKKAKLLSPLSPFLSDLVLWPFCVKLFLAPVSLELWSLAFEAWLLLNL